MMGVAWAGSANADTARDPWAVDWKAASVGSDTAAAPPAWNVRFATDLPAGAPEAGSLLASTRMFDASALEAAGAQAAEQAARPRAVEYSQAYETRRKIHLYASFATLPLFAAQFIVGQKLYNDVPTDRLRSAHGALATSVAGLFAVNTVTGAWNLWEGRHDTNRRTLRFVHGLLMIGADAGFVATGLMAPENEHGRFSGNSSTHRTVALTSMGVATASYLLMLLAR
jgi:hypothetical protein